MKKLSFSFSVRGQKFSFESSERSIKTAKQSKREEGFYLKPTREFFRQVLRGLSRPTCLEVHFQIESDVFSRKSLKKRLKEFSLLRKEEESEAELFLLLKRPKTAVILSEADFERIEAQSEEHFFGKVKRDSDGETFVFPSSIEWLVFFLFPVEISVSSTVRRKGPSWSVLIHAPRGVKLKRTHPLKEELALLAEERSCEWPSPKIEPPPSFSVQTKITSTCNLNCPFCYYREKKESIFRPVCEIIRDIKGIAQCFQRAGFERGTVLFHGGEPTLYPRLPELVQTLSEKCSRFLCRPPFSMTTNGFFLSEEIGLSSLFSRISVSFDIERFRDRKDYEKFVSRLKGLISRMRNLAFLSVAGLSRPRDLFSAYERLFSDLGVKSFPIATERLVSDKPSYTHRQFAEDMIELLELTREKKWPFLAKVNWPSRKVRVAPGCASCTVPSVIDIDGSVRACSKNYAIPPLASLSELLQAIESLDQEEAYSFLTFLCFGKEKKRRKVICQLLGCERYYFCHRVSCVNQPIVDQSLMCLQLEKEFLSL